VGGARWQAAPWKSRVREPRLSREYISLRVVCLRAGAKPTRESGGERMSWRARYEAGHEIDKAKTGRQRRRAAAFVRYRQSLSGIARSRPQTNASHALIDTQNALINSAFLFQS